MEDNNLFLFNAIQYDDKGQNSDPEEDDLK